MSNSLVSERVRGIEEGGGIIAINNLLFEGRLIIRLMSPFGNRGH